MNIHNACTTAGFMWEGVKADDHLLELWNQGCLELCQEVTQYALLSEMFLTAVLTVMPQDFPGVYDYEVSEHFGAWCRQHIEAQPINPVINKGMSSEMLSLLVFNFFTARTEIDPETKESLRTALEAVRQHWLETHQ